MRGTGQDFLMLPYYLTEELATMVLAGEDLDRDALLQKLCYHASKLTLRNARSFEGYVASFGQLASCVQDVTTGSVPVLPEQKTFGDKVSIICTCWWPSAAWFADVLARVAQRKFPHGEASCLVCIHRV